MIDLSTNKLLLKAELGHRGGIYLHNCDTFIDDSWIERLHKRVVDIKETKEIERLKKWAEDYGIDVKKQE